MLPAPKATAATLDYNAVWQTPSWEIREWETAPEIQTFLDPATTPHDRDRALAAAAPALELDRVEDEETAKHLARLAADADLVLELGLKGWRGPSWKKFADVLAKYGFQIMRAWLRSGAIFQKLKTKGIGVGHQGLRREPDDDNELAMETVADAIDAFRSNVLIPGLWDSTRGASLKTFFIGRCLYSFPNVFRRWVLEQDLRPADLDRAALAEVLNAQHAPAPDVSRAAEARRVVGRLQADHPDALSALRAMGYSYAECAEILGTTPAAIRSRLHYNKARRRKPKAHR